MQGGSEEVCLLIKSRLLRAAVPLSVWLVDPRVLGPPTVAPKKGIKRLIQSKHERKVSVAINKNIEQIMAARLASEGGVMHALAHAIRL